MPRVLPEFEGWTVDERLREFRKVVWKGGAPSMRTLKFDSVRGAALRHSYMVWLSRAIGQKEKMMRGGRKRERRWKWSGTTRLEQ